MINLVGKGKRSEDVCERIFRAHGYLTWKTLRVKFQNIDLFGLFDIFAKKKNESHYVQVKTNKISKKNKLINELIEFYRENCGESDYAEIWLRKQGRGREPPLWEITVIHGKKIWEREFPEAELLRSDFGMEEIYK